MIAVFNLGSLNRGDIDLMSSLDFITVLQFQTMAPCLMQQRKVSFFIRIFLELAVFLLIRSLAT
jgi:hypothetical protein